MINTDLTPPSLENGDHLSRTEFERRYQAMASSIKAELIEGMVYMASPTRLVQHGRPHAALMLWLGMYWQATPTVDLGDNVTVRLDLDNEPQPDAVLRLVQGSSRVSEDGFIEGSPELIAEIAASSASYDLHEKKRVYQRNSIREYIVWRVLDEEVDWFELSKDGYTLLKPDPEGVIKSPFFTGLWLNVPALLAGNLTSVLATLHKGLASADLA